MPAKFRMNAIGERVVFNGLENESEHLSIRDIPVEEEEAARARDREKGLKERELQLAITTTPTISGGVIELVFGCSLCDSFSTKDQGEATAHYNAHIKGMGGAQQFLQTVTPAIRAKANDVLVEMESGEIKARKMPSGAVVPKIYKGKDGQDFSEA